MARRHRKQTSHQDAWAEWLKDDMPKASDGEPKTTGFKVNPTMGFDDVEDDDLPPESVQAPIKPSKPRPAVMQPERPQRHVNVSQRPQKASQSPKPQVEPVAAPQIAIQVQLPKFGLPKWRPTRRQIKWAGVCAVVLIALIGSKPLLSHLHTQSTATDKKSGATTATQKMNFVPLTPGDTASQTVKSTATYSSDKGIYQFRDTYKGIPVLISEQPAPDSLLKNPGSLAGIAQKSINAKDSFTTTSGTVYVATLDTGQQRLVFQQRQLLVFIYSSATIDNASWVAYIQSLQ